MEDRQAVIYGVKTRDGYRYIGKTVTSKKNDEGVIHKSSLSQLYIDRNLKEVIVDNEDVDIEQLFEVPLSQWYDEKLSEVVDKHKQGNPLLNSQWQLDGNRGYWQGKTRDPHTIQRLAESKFKRVVQYDEHGKRVRIWESKKQVAQEHFNDYVFRNGHADSQIYYHTMKSRVKYFRNRFDGKHYWFDEQDLLNHFNCVPTKINVEAMLEHDKQRKAEMHRKANQTRVLTHTSRYTVIQTLEDGTERTFDNAHVCGTALGISFRSVRRIIKGDRNKGIYNVKQRYVLRYGEKLRQAVNQR